MRKPLVAVMTAAMSVGIAAFVPVAANAGAGDTASTFTLTGNSSGLSIAVPDGSTTPVNLGSTSTGSASLSHTLGNVTVTDTRGSLAATRSNGRASCRCPGGISRSGSGEGRTPR